MLIKIWEIHFVRKKSESSVNEKIAKHCQKIVELELRLWDF